MHKSKWDAVNYAIGKITVHTAIIYADLCAKADCNDVQSPLYNTIVQPHIYTLTQNTNSYAHTKTQNITLNLQLIP